MNQHRFALALCALVSSLLLADVANAGTYPTSSSTTLSKGYRPIDVFFNTLVEGINYDGGVYSTGPSVSQTGTGSVLDSVTLVFEADWTVSDGFTYPDDRDSGGFAGVWVFEFDAAGLLQTQTSIDDGTLFTVSATEPGDEFGTFTYLGGFLGNLPEEDTPEPGDVFKLFATSAGQSLQVSVLNGELDFVVALNGELVHVGPFVVCPVDDDDCESSSESFGDIDDVLCGIDGLTLDMTRNFEGCEGAFDDACGRVTALNATNVPEPGTLALFGLGLASLGIRFRRRKALLV